MLAPDHEQPGGRDDGRAQLLTHAGVRKTHPPPRGLLLRDLVERHQIGGWDGEAELAAAVERYRRFLARTAATSAANVGP